MHGAAGGVEFLLEAVDLFPQPIAFPPIAIPLAAGFVSLPTQAFVLALPSLEFGDQLLAGGRVPAHVHGPVMACLPPRYKYGILDPVRRRARSGQ
jgi:hypothetical protein